MGNYELRIVFSDEPNYTVLNRKNRELSIGTTMKSIIVALLYQDYKVEVVQLVFRAALHDGLGLLMLYSGRMEQHTLCDKSYLTLRKKKKIQ